MKNFIITYWNKLLLITIMMFTALIGLCGCAGDYKKTVTSVETMTLTLHGMRGTSVYEIADEAGKTELRRYREIFSSGESILELEKSTVCDTQEFIELMNTCGVIRWDGFHGKHPKNVKDGIMFIFTATVNGGQAICADGSANFPKGYHEFVRELNSMLAECENN